MHIQTPILRLEKELGHSTKVPIVPLSSTSALEKTPSSYLEVSASRLASRPPQPDVGFLVGARLHRPTPWLGCLVRRERHLPLRPARAGRPHSVSYGSGSFHGMPARQARSGASASGPIAPLPRPRQPKPQRISQGRRRLVDFGDGRAGHRAGPRWTHQEPSRVVAFQSRGVPKSAMLRGGDGKKAIAKEGRACVRLVREVLDNGDREERNTGPKTGRHHRRRAS